MKTTILKNKLLYIFILLSLAISFNSCSDDDDDVTTQTFLEKYDGTKWVYTGEYTVYIRINNNTNKFVEQWFFVFEAECYYYDFDYVSENTEIIENLKDKIIFKYTDEGVTETVTVTVQGDVLKVIVQYDGETETILFDKTSVNVDAFEICIDED